MCDASYFRFVAVGVVLTFVLARFGAGLDGIGRLAKGGTFGAAATGVCSVSVREVAFGAGDRSLSIVEAVPTAAAFGRAGWTDCRPSA